MSEQYPGGFITKVPPTPAGPYDTSSATGLWNLSQQAAYKQQGLWPTAGNVNPSAFIENLFSTYLYTGNGSTQTITNGINLSTNGGMVWTKLRTDAFNHVLIDTARGGTGTCVLNSNTTGAASAGNQTNLITPFNSNGYTIATDWAELNSGTAGRNYASWTFRKQPKFFDIVTYTGTGTTAQNINHNLGSVPGCIIIKRTDSTGDWGVVHRSTNAYANYGFVGGKLNTTGVVGQTVAQDTGIYYDNSTYFQVDEGSAYFNPNASGGTYVAYLFAHDAGGFGLTGTDNVISCGSFTYVSGTLSVNLGYEPQWVMIKQTNGVGSWFMNDNMRNWRADNSTTGTGTLYAQSSNAEGTGGADWNITSTGFTVTSGTGTFIYIAIRRGPMKVPTLGTSVFSPVARNGTGSATNITGVGFPVDLGITKNRGSGELNQWTDRLQGGGQYMTSAATNENTVTINSITSFNQNGVTLGSGDNAINSALWTYIDWFFLRAPNFFDEVCYSGTGSVQNVSHNLAAVPELMIVKRRNTFGFDWLVYSAPTGNTNRLLLNETYQAASGTSFWNDTTPTSAVFTLGTNVNGNGSGGTYVAYLFATCPGVSKVGSYTGTGALQTVNCGFTSGARFVLIKRTDSTGNWYTYDSARGITSGNDPYILLNSAAAEVTSTNYVDANSTGFQVTAAAPAELNANGGTYIFLAIA